MTYQPVVPPQAARGRARARARANARARGLGDVGATPAPSVAQAAAQTVVSEIPVIGPVIAPFVAPLVNIFDPGAKRDAGRKQRANGIAALANEGSLLAARQLYGAAVKGAVGAKAEIALYTPLWAALQQAHPDIAAAAVAAGSAGVGPDPVNGWNPPASDVAQYSKEIQQYKTLGTVASAAQAATARASIIPGGTTGLLIGAGLLFAFLRRR